MSFFERIGLTPNPATVHDQVRVRVDINAVADQIDAECAEVRRLAPTENDFLRDEYAGVVHRALASMDESHDFDGTAPVLTVSPFGVPTAAENTRDDAQPIASRAVVAPCHSCCTASSIRTPFWLAVGRHILQIELCRHCAVDAIDRGAKPQNLTIPDSMPERLA